MTGMAGETRVWLETATSIPSTSPRKMMFRRFFVALLATDPPSVFHRLRQLVQQAPQFHVFFLAQGAANPVLKDFAPLGSHLKGSPAFRGQAHAHHPVVLWVAGSLDPALTLQLLGQPRYARRIHAVEAADLTLADAGFLGEHVKDEVLGGLIPTSRSKA